MEKIANHKADREELNQLINDYEETMKEFNNEVNNIMQNQSSVQQSTSQTLNYHGVNIVEPLEVFSDIQAIKTFWSGMVEADSAAKSSFSDAQPDVQQLEKKMITFLEAIGKDGGKVGSLDVDKLRSAVFEDKGMLNAIEEKLRNGDSLSSAERDLLYQYLQNEFFGEKDHEKMQNLSYMMEHDQEGFRDYINEEVLATERNLEAEIMFLELYLFKGDQRPDELTGSEEDHIKWNNYLQVLKNAHMDIQETREIYRWDRGRDEPLYAHLEFIESEFSRNPISGRTQSEIQILAHPESYEEHLTKEQIFESERQQPFYLEQRSVSDVEYFFGRDGVNNYAQREMIDDDEEMKTYTGDFIAEELFGVALSALPGEEALSVIMTFGEYSHGKKEHEQNMEVGEIKQAAAEFDLELHVNDHRLGHNLDMQLIPSDKTFDILDRWKAVHQVDSSIPYPETEIDEQDWASLNTLMFGELDDEEGGYKAEMIYDHDRDIYNYIMDGDDSDNPTVKNAEKIMDQ